MFVKSSVEPPPGEFLLHCPPWRRTPSTLFSPTWTLNGSTVNGSSPQQRLRYLQSAAELLCLQPLLLVELMSLLHRHLQRIQGSMLFACEPFLKREEKVLFSETRNTSTPQLRPLGGPSDLLCWERTHLTWQGFWPHSTQCVELADAPAGGADPPAGGAESKVEEC